MYRTAVTWLPRRCVCTTGTTVHGGSRMRRIQGAAHVSRNPLLCSGRTVSDDRGAPLSSAASASASVGGVGCGVHSQDGPPSALAVDDLDVWLESCASRGRAAGKSVNHMTDTVRDVVQLRPEFRDVLQQARNLLHGNDPTQLTRYQQKDITERLLLYSSSMVSRQMSRAHTEESAMQRHSQDGSSTGENYWLEAGYTLSSSDVPRYVKDDIISNMQKDRGPNSPAFQGSTTTEKD